MNLLKKNSEWLYITPIYRLEIGNVLHGEILIGRVMFVDIKKLPRIRKRIGLPVVVSAIEKRIKPTNFFEESKTYAILKVKGVPELMENECRRKVEDAVNILSASQLGFCSRSSNSQFGLIKQRSNIIRLFINKTIFESHLNKSVENKVLPFRLDSDWQGFHKDFFFFDFLKILPNTRAIQKKWKDTIVRSVIMVGKSMQSRDLEYCFLWNMIVIEMLLTEQGDKYSTTLPERAEAFLGWVGYWEEKKFEERIRSLYSKRCQFVHDGNSANITVQDVLFTDDLVFNLLLNIINHIHLFPCKESVINFSKKVQAEKLLGVQPKVQPKTLKFMNRDLNREDLKRL